MAGQTAVQAIVVDQASPKSGQEFLQLALFNSDGTQLEIPSAAAAQADVAALTSAAITGGESPTEAEHNALRADLVATRTTLNSLMAKMRTAGLLETS